MDWLRRNWPDLIIGVALIAVVALIVVTLLSGGSLASLVRRDSPPELSVADTAPGTAANTDAPANTAEAEPGNSTQAGNGASAPGNTDANNANSSTADLNETGVDVFVPGIPGEPTGAASSASGGQAQASVPSSGAQSGGVAQSGAQGAQADAAGGPLPEAVQDGGFRVAAGAVDSRDAAASLAETFRDADYTVTVEQQGEFYLLWVGPYATRPGADQVAARLQTDGLVPDALVYSYDGPDDNTNGGNTSSDGDNTNSGDTNTSPASTSGGAGDASATASAEAGASANTPARNANTATNTAAGTAADTAADTATPENTGAASASSAGNSAANAGANTTATASTGNAASGAAGQRYLQVGAFATDESAQPLRQQLETLGFNVTRRQSGTGLVRLLIGPLADAQIAQAQTRLNGEGITDAFPVAP